MKKTLTFICLILLAGCQTHTKQTPGKALSFPTALEIKNQCELETPQQVESRELHVWMCQSVTAIEYRFFDADKYQGKTCDIVITQPLGKQPANVNAEGGDPALCTVALKATEQAINSGTFPMRPATLKDKFILHFAPERG